MTSPRILIDESDRGPEPPHVKRERELYERYYRKFKEHPPSFGLPPESDQARLARIEQAIKTGQSIVENIPPGCDA